MAGGYGPRNFVYGVNVGITTGGQQLLDALPGRALLKIVNTGATAITISPHGNPASGAAGFSLAAGATYEPQNVPGNAWWASATTGTSTVYAAHG